MKEKLLKYISELEANNKIVKAKLDACEEFCYGSEDWGSYHEEEMRMSVVIDRLNKILSED